MAAHASGLEHKRTKSQSGGRLRRTGQVDSPGNIVDRVLKDEVAVGAPNGQGSPRPSLSNHEAQNGYPESKHLPQVVSNGLTLAQLLGSLACIGARGVHKGHNGEAEFVGMPHEPHGLTVPIGLGHAEIPADVLLGVAALLLTDEHEARAVHAADTADNGRVVEAGAVAVQLDKLVSDVEDDVEAGGAVRVPRDLEPLDRREPAIGLFPQL